MISAGETTAGAAAIASCIDRELLYIASEGASGTFAFISEERVLSGSAVVGFAAEATTTGAAVELMSAAGIAAGGGAWNRNSATARIIQFTSAYPIVT